MNINNKILLKEKHNNSILRLVLNDPKRKNALSEDMIFALNSHISASSVDKSVKVIIISSNSNVFSSGHNLKEKYIPEDHPDIELIWNGLEEMYGDNYHFLRK